MLRMRSYLTGSQLNSGVGPCKQHLRGKIDGQGLHRSMHHRHRGMSRVVATAGFVG